RFARRCNRRDMLTAGRAIQALLNSSRRLYDELLREEPLDCEWEARGVLFVYQTRAAFEHSFETERLLRDQFGLAADRYGGEALPPREPALKPGLAGGWLYRTDAHLRPDRLMASWRRALEARGVEIREGCELTGFVRQNGRAVAAVTARGELPA